MSGQQQAHATEDNLSDGDVKEMWAAAARDFERICGESLDDGKIKNFGDLEKTIESVQTTEKGEENSKLEKAKSFGLASLKALKVFVDIASQAGSLAPIPGVAVQVSSNALSFVFGIPEKMRDYDDAVNGIFEEVSSTLSSFKIYNAMETVDPELTRHLNPVLASFVRLCAHVVTYKQASKVKHWVQKVKAGFGDDEGLAREREVFRLAVQRQRAVEATAIFRVAVSTQQSVQEVQKRVQVSSDDTERRNALARIHDALHLPGAVRLDTKTSTTCSDFARERLEGTGEWLWSDSAYSAWTSAKGGKTSHVLFVSGPPSSGKTVASALITQRLEHESERTYVAHHFFSPGASRLDEEPAGGKRPDEQKSLVALALKDMAFQLARADITVQKALTKACAPGTDEFRSSAQLLSSSLDILWRRLKIGASGSATTYYLVFDGLENLSSDDMGILLSFLCGLKPTGGTAARVRVLASLTSDRFAVWSRSHPHVVDGHPLHIRMEDRNKDDMLKVIEARLSYNEVLQRPRPGSYQDKARTVILKRLPERAEGSYAQLEFGLEEVLRLLSKRSSMRELETLLDRPISSQEAAIKNLQHSLMADEISELNELLKWVLYGRETMTLDWLEAVVSLHSNTQSITSLGPIIKNKYSAVLRLEGDRVIGQDSVVEHLKKTKRNSGRAIVSNDDSATISMSITIDNVEKEHCTHFLWDLTHRAVRDKFNFFDPGVALVNGQDALISVDAFEAHHTIVKRAFEYLSREEQSETRDIGRYLVSRLPHHLNCLRELENCEEGRLTDRERIALGQSLYSLFRDGDTVRRHQASFEQTCWTVEEIEYLQEWLTDSAVVRKLDKCWRDRVRYASSPMRGFMTELAKCVVNGFLMERSWSASSAVNWIGYFIDADTTRSQSPTTGFFSKFGLERWDCLSAWCQEFLGLSPSALDAHWYERIAEASPAFEWDTDVVVSLYERAVAAQDPSWQCYRDFGAVHYRERRISKAIELVEMALRLRESASPSLEVSDIIDLRLLLGQYVYEDGNGDKALEHFLLATESDDPKRSTQGFAGQLKARLNMLHGDGADAERARELLKTLIVDAGDKKLVNALGAIARDSEHGDILSKLLIVFRTDFDLLKSIRRALAAATEMPDDREEQVGSSLLGDHLAENEVLGVLLYHRGVAAYFHEPSDKVISNIGEVLLLWNKSRAVFSNIGGPNAFATRETVTFALAKHHFDVGRLVEEKHLHLEHVTALMQLIDPDDDGLYASPVEFLGALHAVRLESELAKAALVKRMQRALQILSDEITENDQHGYHIARRALLHYQDFRNAGVAISLSGEPDLVTAALSFEIDSIGLPNGGAAGSDSGSGVVELANGVIQATKTQIPDARQQLQRIVFAKAHVDALVNAISQPGSGTLHVAEGEHNSDTKTLQEDSQDTTNQDPAIILQRRLSTLHSTHTPQIDISSFDWICSCDGRDPTSGKRCAKMCDFEVEFYHCLYCPDVDFCSNCLNRLRELNDTREFTVCSAQHRWIRLPPYGANVYVGPRATVAQVPKVQEMEGDDSILELVYSGEEISVDEWKQQLAKDWGILLEEVAKESADAV